MHDRLEKFFIDHECQLCGRKCQNRRSLGNHLARSHSEWKMESYVLQYCYNGNVPLCDCGCGNEVKWHKQLYKFNAYLSGHNNTWSADNQPKLSSSQIERRNESIRRSYVIHGAEIKEKISSAVRQSLSRDEWKDAQSKRSFALWEDPKFRQKVSDSQKKAWKENYHERYEAVFTDEFRRKISIANSERDIKRKSAQEVELFHALAKILPVEIVADHWVQWDGGSKCFDAWVPSWNLLIEFDGVYWHGLDRAEGFTIDQVISLANDLLKNRIARSKDYNLVRIAMTPDVIQSIQGMDSMDLTAIQKLAYHHQELENVIKDGMFIFESDEQCLLYRSDLIRWNEESLGGLGREETKRRLFPAVVRFFEEYFRDPRRGWFFPRHDGNIVQALEDVRDAPAHKLDDAIIIGNPRAGNDFLKSHMHSFWYADCGPAEICTDPRVLERVISYRMGLNGSKPYTYEITPGVTVSTQETFDINPKNIRNGFVVQRSSVSWFSPVLARDLWRMALAGCDVESPVVWDPSAGFGARLLGFASAYSGGTYIATEPAILTFGDLEKLRDSMLNSGWFKGEIFLEKTGSEKVKLPEKFLDAVMTSPPYFDLEKYFDEPGQCWRDYPDFDSWRDKYLLPTLMTANQALKPGACAIINVSQDLEETVISIAKKVNFRHEKTLYLARRKDHYSRKKGVTDSTGEPVIFLRVPMS